MHSLSLEETVKSLSDVYSSHFLSLKHYDIKLAIQPQRVGTFIPALPASDPGPPPQKVAISMPALPTSDPDLHLRGWLYHAHPATLRNHLPPLGPSTTVDLWLYLLLPEPWTAAD